MLFVIKDVPKNYFAKIGVFNASIFDKGPKKALRNPSWRHSKAPKMETNGLRDLKFGLK